MRGMRMIRTPAARGNNRHKYPSVHCRFCPVEANPSSIVSAANDEAPAPVEGPAAKKRKLNVDSEENSSSPRVKPSLDEAVAADLDEPSLYYY